MKLLELEMSGWIGWEPANVNQSVEGMAWVHRFCQVCVIFACLHVKHMLPTLLFAHIDYSWSAVNCSKTKCCHHYHDDIKEVNWWAPLGIHSTCCYHWGQLAQYNYFIINYVHRNVFCKSINVNLKCQDVLKYSNQMNKMCHISISELLCNTYSSAHIRKF